MRHLQCCDPKIKVVPESVTNRILDTDNGDDTNVMILREGGRGKENVRDQARPSAETGREADVIRLIFV